MNDDILPAFPRVLVRPELEGVDKYLSGQISEPPIVAPLAPCTTPVSYWFKGNVSGWFEKLFSPFKGGEPMPHPRRIEASTRRFMDGIQGNILTPHGRDYGVMLFFHYHGTAEQMRTFLQEAEGLVTSALKQYQQARYKHEKPNEPFVSFALTKDGIRAAGCRMPSEKHGAFAAGMLKRREGLGDGEWSEREFADEDLSTVIHGAWLLASAQPPLLAELDKKIRSVGDGRVEVRLEQRGVTLRNHDGHPVEPFGFRDGISMPEFFVSGKPSDGLTNLPLTQVLINSNENDRGGSFLVYRKLRQHVDKFRNFERSLALEAKKWGMDPIDAGRLLIGRKRDGTPLVPLKPDAIQPTKKDLNRFDYSQDKDEVRCPFHAHIRKANPRSLQKRFNERKGQEIDVQIVRRGMVYGTGDNVLYNPLLPAPENTGLLFLAYMSEIANQFEFMQTTWLSHRESPGAPLNQRDPILYGGRDKSDTWHWSGMENASLNLEAFVTTLGGAYLFVPPRSWLRNPPVATD